jgi:predicted nucleic acid-binding protein
MHFVDTNIFIRYLTRDDPDKAKACFELFKRASTNEIALTTTEAVMSEVVYVLSSKKTYNLARPDIRARLYPLLSVKEFTPASAKSDITRS